MSPLSSGRTPANTWSMPSSAATASATCGASPVIITTRRPRACRASTASRDSARTLSARLERPDPRTVDQHVQHDRPLGPPGLRAGQRLQAVRPGAGPGRRPRRCRPSTTAVTPTAGEEVNDSAPRDTSIRRSSGRSDDRLGQRVLALGLPPPRPSPSSSLLVDPARRQRPPVTTGRPSVRVPVLSNRTVSTVRIASRAIRSVIKMPPRAARSVAIDDHQRDGQAQGVRAGDDQHRDASGPGRTPAAPAPSTPRR